MKVLDNGNEVNIHDKFVPSLLKQFPQRFKLPEEEAKTEDVLPEEETPFKNLSRDELFKIAEDKGINVPKNIGTAKLIERLSENG